MKTLIKIRGALAVCGLLGVFATPPAVAHIVIDGSPGYVSMIEECLNDILSSGGKPAAVITQLLTSTNVHTVTEGTGAGGGPDNFNDATPNADGSAGAGSGSENVIDPNFKDGDGKKPPWWTVLIHELTHSAQADGGTYDPSPGENGVRKAEIGACDVENEYRRTKEDAGEKNHEQRTEYGGKPLPASAIH